MESRRVEMPKLGDIQLKCITNRMRNNQLWAYGLLDQTEEDKLWENMSCLTIFKPKVSGMLLKACWERKVDNVCNKQFLFMKTGEGSLTDIEKDILSVIVEQDLEPWLTDEQNVKLPQSTGETTRSHNNEYPPAKKLKKMEFQKDGLQLMENGHEILANFMTNIIGLSNNRNRVVSIGMNQAITNVETLIEQIDEFAQNRMKK